MPPLPESELLADSLDVDGLASVVLRPLPFITFGELATPGLEAHVYCPSCHTTRQVDPTVGGELPGRKIDGRR
ncbi:MAG: hypothetical protein QOJ15_3170 [Bradyrhizobium sp.]|nr:hypothetical protein [Bradyrhizobium sp.]